MPLLYQQNIDAQTIYGLWYITEDENFFSNSVPLLREIKSSRMRRQHLAARFLLKLLAPNISLQEIRVANSGRPSIDNNEYHFSLSHCNDYAAAIVSTKQPVGIDVEEVKPKILKIVDKFLSSREIKIVNKIPGVAEENYTLAWCCKEVAFKWLNRTGVDFKTSLSIKNIEEDDNGYLTSMSVYGSELLIRVSKIHRVLLAFTMPLAN